MQYAIPPRYYDYDLGLKWMAATDGLKRDRDRFRFSDTDIQSGLVGKRSLGRPASSVAGRCEPLTDFYHIDDASLVIVDLAFAEADMGSAC